MLDFGKRIVLLTCTHRLGKSSCAERTKLGTVGILSFAK